MEQLSDLSTLNPPELQQDEILFEELNTHLQRHGEGVPQLILDREAFAHNVQLMQLLLARNSYLKPRLVVKSIANLSLLAELSAHFNTRRYMVFHLAHLIPLLQMQADAQILLGKPMPTRALEHFYTFDVLALQQGEQTLDVHWLVDTLDRAHEYLDLAKRLSLRLKLNIEIDIGLHRGGVADQQEFLDIVGLIVDHSEYLQFSGAMGYDAHVTKLPQVMFNKQKLYEQSQIRYQFFKDLIAKKFPALNHNKLIWNGGGSPTLAYHFKHSVCNDLSFGSVLFKPLDFKIDELRPFQHALYIATPILKIQPNFQLPALEKISSAVFRQQALFVYGGYWMADYVYPKGIKINALYGRSSNQELVTLPKGCQVSTQDYVFLIPHQSEAVIPQFQKLSCYKSGQITQFENLRE